MTSYPDQRALSQARTCLEGWGIPVIRLQGAWCGRLGFAQYVMGFVDLENPGSRLARLKLKIDSGTCAAVAPVV